MLDTSTVPGEAAEAVAFREAKDSILPVEARGLIFEAGGKRLIDGIDLRLTAGSVTMIMGPNGAGKSVLIRLLHGLLQPTSGKIIWGGKAFDQTVRKRQAMVFQTPVLLRRSVAANIAFALRLNGAASTERCSQLLELAGLTRQADQPARLLSGGECQRLAIARALATEPDVLFLDEPTVSLDPASVLAIEEIIARARDRGVKIIFITHDTGQARRLGDEIVFLHRGKVVERSRGTSFFDAPASSEARDYLAGRIVL